jgi:hypothetical protein
MDTELLVDSRIDDGLRFVTQLGRDAFEVVLAFWVRTSEEGSWYLYLASPAVDAERIGDAYRIAYASLNKLPDSSLSLSDIRLVHPDHPIAQDVREILRRYPPGRMPTRSRCPTLGGLAIDEVYIYPPQPRQGGRPFPCETRRLRSDVEQKAGVEALLAPFTPQEQKAYEQIVASGATPAQAEYWVRKKREQQPRPPIPAGTVVKARVTAWWGDKPEDDPNPLLLVAAPDGAQGLTFKNNTDPV